MTGNAHLLTSLSIRLGTMLLLSIERNHILNNGKLNK